MGLPSICTQRLLPGIAAIPYFLYSAFASSFTGPLRKYYLDRGDTFKARA